MPRGRPKKNPVQLSADEGGDADVSLASAVGSPAPVRRGRGRPPKNAVQLRQEDTGSKDVQDASPKVTETPAPVRRGRGRPPKNPVQPGQEDTNDEDDQNASPKATEAPAPVRRGRGRPPKNPVQPRQEDTHDEDDQNVPPKATPAPVRRGRGRPPKNPAQPKNEDTDNDKVQDSPAQDSEAPTQVTRRGRGRPNKVETPGSASRATSSPAQVASTSTGRPRGRPRKASKAVSFATTSTAQANATPTGRGRGRPPKIASISPPQASSVTQEPEISFAFENLIGSYTVRSPAIETMFIPGLYDDVEDTTLHGSLEISQDMLDDQMLFANFKFGDISGTMAMCLSFDRLREWVGDNQSGEEERVTNDLIGDNDETGGRGGKGNARDDDEEEEDEEDDNGGNSDILNIKHELDGLAAGMKRKAAPVKRGRGRPPKKTKQPLPTPPPPSIIVYFVYSHEIAGEHPDNKTGRRFGTMEPDDNECKSVHGVFPNFPVINRLAVFHAKKVETIAAAEPSEASVEEPGEE